MARLKAPVEAARVASFAPLSPTAIAPVNSPLAIAVVLSPIPIAKLVGVLVQVEPPELPALRPLIDAHVALAAPAPPSAAAAKPDATAPRSTPPVTLFLPMVCPFRDRWQKAHSISRVHHQHSITAKLC